ncbi:NADPH-dependent glutamate synthase [Balneolales bacterium ANBcel1]|nr:NADPH-dependent glutamate synthase [Balneolales bacterium ANBcel1]
MSKKKEAREKFKKIMPMKPRERMQIPRHLPLEQKPECRIENFAEVSNGFNVELAAEEALRCLECNDPVCMQGCPVNVDIRSFIGMVYQKDYQGAINKIRESNYLPAICGRVCPQESLCESVCLVGKKNEPLAIGKLERFVADYELKNGGFTPPQKAEAKGQSVAVVGSGPGGLTVSAELARMGYDVTIFEALHEAGGVLKFGIPEFRLPKHIVDAEIDRVKALGVKIETNVIIGRTLTIDELFDEMGFEAVYLGTGAGSPRFLNIPGENLSDVYSASELLTRVNLMKAYKFPEYDTPLKLGRRVAVIGGGDVAMDAVRTSKRFHPEKTILLYRRSREEMPARAEEVHHAEEEGIEFHYLTNPVRIHGNEDGSVRAIECQKMELGEPDEQGRRRPVPVKDSNFMMEVDTVIVAIGQSPNPIIQQTTPGLETSKWGTIIVDEHGATSRKGVFAGGDISRGGATVIQAVADGKLASRSIDSYLASVREERSTKA